MRRILIVIGVLSMFSFTSNTKMKLAEANKGSIEIAWLDCNELAQGYYEFLLSEGEDNIEAGKRARAFRDACEDVY